jgi:hypothetical protein
MGEGVLKLPAYTEKKELKIDSELQSIFTKLGIKPTHPIRDQTSSPLSDRKALANIVFDILGLTEIERSEIYRSASETGKNRVESVRRV